MRQSINKQIIILEQNIRRLNTIKTICSYMVGTCLAFLLFLTFSPNLNTQYLDAYEHEMDAHCEYSYGPGWVAETEEIEGKEYTGHICVNDGAFLPFCYYNCEQYELVVK